MTTLTDDDIRRQFCAELTKRVTGEDVVAGTECTLTLNGNVVVVKKPNSSELAIVTMTFRHPIDRDPPTRFSITRSRINRALVRLGAGEAVPVADVAEELATVFLRQARPTSPA